MFIKLYCWSNNIFYYGATALVAQGLLIIEDSRSHSVKHTTLGRNPLDERSACRRDLNLKTHNAQKDKPPCPWRDSNPQSQEANDRRPTS
jgi:hypothetical protein